MDLGLRGQVAVVVGAASGIGRAIAAAFSGGLPTTPDAISAAAADFNDDTTEQLEAFDSEFFQYPHNLTDLLFTFVSQHPEEFGPLPKVDDA